MPADRGAEQVGSEFTPLWHAVRRAVEPYEDAILTSHQADALASDVLAILEEQA